MLFEKICEHIILPQSRQERCRLAQKATRYSSRVPSKTGAFEQPWVTLRVFRHRLDGRIHGKRPRLFEASIPLRRRDGKDIEGWHYRATLYLPAIVYNG